MITTVGKLKEIKCLEKSSEVMEVVADISGIIFISNRNRSGKSAQIRNKNGLNETI